MGPCTATLIHPRAILTASHCFDDQTNTGDAADGGVFVYDNSTKERWITSFVSLGDGNDRARDLAVGALVSDADGAFPRSLASNFPSNPNEVVRVIGHGCGDPLTDGRGRPYCTMESDFSVKRELDFFWFGLSDDHMLSSDESGQLSILLSGDSGGPVLDGGGRIIFVNSGTEYWANPGGPIVRADDMFGKVPANLRAIQNALVQLGIL